MKKFEISPEYHILLEIEEYLKKISDEIFQNILKHPKKQSRKFQEKLSRNRKYFLNRLEYLKDISRIF